MENTEPPPEILITGNERTRGIYMDYIMNTLKGGKDSVVIKATGSSMTHALTIARECRQRIKKLYQLITINRILPSKEGNRECIKFGIEIVLSKKELDANDRGYIGPLPEYEVRDLEREAYEIHRRRRQAYNAYMRRGFRSRRYRRY